MTELQSAPASATGPSRDRIAGAVLFGMGVLIAWQGWTLPFGSFRVPGPGMLPVTLAAILAVFGVLIAIRGGGPGLRALGWKEARHALSIFGALSFSAAAMETLGYRATVAAVLIFLVGVVERKGWLATVLLAAGFAFGSYALFADALKVPLPLGPFGF